MIDWDLVRCELNRKTIDELHELEREDYHAYLDRLTEGMTADERRGAYERFASLLRATYEGKVERLKTA